MKNTTTSFDAAVKKLAEIAKRQAGSPPPVEELEAYLNGQLDPQAQERMRDRLALDTESSRTTLDLIDLDRPHPSGEPERNTGPVDFVPGHVPDWSSMEARLAEEDGLASRAPSAREDSRAMSDWGYLAARFAAAALVIVALGLWYRSPSESPRSLPGLEINVHSVQLQPDGIVLRRLESPWQEVSVPAGAPRLGLSLNLGDPGSFPDYQVEILRPGSDLKWSARGLRPSPIGTFDLLVPRDSLPAGRYLIDLQGLDGNRSQTLARYRMEISYR